eukprot:775622_1
MSSEFQEFLKLIGRIIIWIFKMTINLICAVFLVCACVAVWRIPWICCSIAQNVSSSSDFREICFMQFLCSILDYLTIIPALIGFVSPTRTYHLTTKIIEKLTSSSSYYDGHDYMYKFSIRSACWTNCGIGLVDNICLVFGLMSAVIPTRTRAFFRIIGYFWQNYFDDDYLEMRVAWFRNGALGVYDLFILPHCIAIVFPTRTYALVHDIYTISCKDTKPPNFVFQQDYLHYNVDYRIAILKSFWIGFVDLFNIPLFIVCILSVYNGIELVHLMKDYRYRWNNRIRLKILINFAWVVFDIIFVLPLLLVIGVTLYRVPCVLGHMRHSWSIYYKIRNHELTPDEVNNDENKPLNTRIHILCNFLLVVYDILFTLISLILIFITGYRIPILCKDILSKTTDNDDQTWNPFAQANNNTTQLDKYEEYVDALVQRLLICQQALYILLDIPCFILAIIVYVTLWRSVLLHKALWRDIPQQIEDNTQHNQQNPNATKKTPTTVAPPRRRAVLWQCGFLLRDMVCMVLFVVIIGTLYRLPFVVLALMSKLSTPNIKEDEKLDIEEATLHMPDKGKITIHVKGTKPSDLAFADKKAVGCKLYVLGSRFWKEVGDKFGGTIKTAAQSQLPNKWSHDNGFDYDLVRDPETDFDIVCTLQTPELKRKVIHNNIRKMDHNVSMVLQLEADDPDIGILAIFILTVDDLVTCSIIDGNGTLSLEKGTHFACDKERIETLRGTDFPSVIDAFWMIVLEQFAYLMIDILHLILLILPIGFAPWRFIKCCLLLCRDKSYWYVQEHDRAMGMLEHSYFIYRQFYYHYFQPMMNDMVKDEYEYHRSNTSMGLDALHINYSHYYRTFKGKLNKYWARTYEYMKDSNEDNPNKFNMSLTTYDEIVLQIDNKLRKLKPIPASLNLCRDYFEMQNVRLYIKMMHSTMNLFLMNKKISTQHHAIIAEQLNIENFKYEEDMERYHQMIHDAHNDLELELKKVSKEKSCVKKVFSKDISTMQKMIRFCFMKACQDILALIVIILILCTIYRTVPFVRDLYHVIRLKIAYFRMKHNKNKAVGPSLRFGLKKAIQKHVVGFGRDVWNLVQFIFCSVLIVVTLVRLTEFILKLIDGGRERGEAHFSLEVAVEIAKDELSEVPNDFWQLFVFFTMWKFYKFGMASAVFGVLLPSTAFLEIYAFVCGCCARKFRLYVAIITWFGFLSVIIYYLADMGRDNVDPKVFIILSFITLLFTFVFYVLLFCCFRHKSYDIDDENEAFYRNQVSYVKPTKHVAEVYDKLCVKCDNVCVKDTIQNIEEYYRIQEQIDGRYTYYYWRYNRRCEFCRDYLYGYNIGYHCKPCNIIVCHWCSRHLKNDKIHNRAELQEGYIPGGFNSSHIKRKMDDIGIILWSYPNDGYVPLHVRFTWPNILAYVAIVWEVLQLMSVFLFVVYVASILNNHSIPTVNDMNQDVILKAIFQSSKWLLLSHRNIDPRLYEAINVILLILGVFWMIICALPLVCEQLFNFVDKRGTFTQSSMWIKCAWFFTRIMYVFLIIQWIRLFQCIPTADEDNNQCLLLTAPDTHEPYYSGKGTLAFIIIIFYWLTAGITVVYNTAQIVLQRDFHIDIVYPIVFIHCLQLLQSLFIVSAMLLILYDVNGALLFCLILSYLMLIWHVLYAFISKQMLQDSDHQDLISSLSSLPHVIVFRFSLYLMLAYNTTILYLYFTSNVPSQNIGSMLLIGSLIILCNGIIIAFIYHRISLKRRREALSKSAALKSCLQLLISLYNKTDANGIIGDWRKDGASKMLSQIIDENDPKNDIKTSTSKLFSVSDVAGIIIEFERHILFERLTESFLNQRKEWIRLLLQCETFDDIIPLILDLVNGIQIPPFFTVGFNILKDETMFAHAPLAICSLVMQFLEDYGVADLCNLHLTDIDKIPSHVLTLDRWGEYFSIANSIDRFGGPIGDKVKTFVNKTLFWHSHKKERLYGSYLGKSKSNSLNVSDLSTTLYVNDFNIRYVVLLPEYLVWFDHKVDMKSLEASPIDYADISTFENDNVTRHGVQFLTRSNNNNNNSNVVEEKEEKKSEELEKEDQRKMKGNALFLFSCKDIKEDSSRHYYHWYRYYWWWYNRKTYVFGALNNVTYDKWTESIDKAFAEKRKTNQQLASTWAKGIGDKIKKNEDKKLVQEEDPWKAGDNNNNNSPDEWEKFDGLFTIDTKEKCERNELNKENIVTVNKPNDDFAGFDDPFQE